MNLRFAACIRTAARFGTLPAHLPQWCTQYCQGWTAADEWSLRDDRLWLHDLLQIIFWLG